MRAKILIIDDDFDTIRLLNEVLRGLGDVFFATDGASAIRTAQEKQPDIVLLDAQMPGMDGFEVCAALKADPATAEATVIFVTANVDIAHETRALNLGAIDFIHKPISPPVVRARIQNHITMKAQAEELKRFATTDPLTGLFNRRTFDVAIDREWRRARRTGSFLAIVMVDVDYFKQFNDCYGHPAGDACLQKVAKVVGDSAKRSGDTVARYGGEEFILLLPDTDVGRAITYGGTLCSAVRALHIEHANSPLGGVVTVSVGVASVVPTADISAASLVELADKALYDAKEAGRDRVAATEEAAA